MREQPTPCINASRAQVVRGLHMTFEDSRICASCSADVGLVSSARGTRSVDGMGPATFAAVASSDHGTALARSSGTFGDVFLSVGPSPGEQFRSVGVTPSPSEPVNAGTAHHPSWLSPVLPSGHERHESPQPST